MNILVVGSGGREHAISLCVYKSKYTKNLFVAPGNPGIAEFAKCIPVAVDDLDGQCKLAKKIKADIVIIGPEVPLVLGLKDKLEAMGIQAFGPSKNAAQLEGSKVFARIFCERQNIPQPKFKYCNDIQTATNEIKLLNGYCVIKADGLAAGKGVIICETIEEAIYAAKTILEDKKFGRAGNTILIEERIEGIEASLFAICDGKDSILLGTAQDYKRAYNNDKGPNTGGMGAISPAPALNKNLVDNIMKNIVLKTIQGMKLEDMDYEGILYVGIMITKSGPKLIEFNCRLGDPETQVILPLLKTDFVEILRKAISKNLHKMKIEHIKKNALNVVVASNGYPGKFIINQILPSLKNAKGIKDITIYHSGTNIDKNRNLINSGGRVLSLTSVGNTFEMCREKAYTAVKLINWQGGFYRDDIGKSKNLP